MPTRADYYIGTGPSAEWLGSSTYDGYPAGTPELAVNATDEPTFRAAVEEILANGDATRPAEGWPWPWKDSRTTDYAYAWTPAGVRLSSFGRTWESYDDYLKRTADETSPELAKLTDAEVLDMTSRKADAATVIAKSGLVIIGM